MDTFVVIIALLELVQLAISGVDYRWCSYELNTYPLQWAAANAVCENKGLKLAVISETATHDYLRSLVSTSLTFLDRNAPQTMWLGLHKDLNGVLRQGDCSVYTAIDYDPTVNVNKDCVVFDAANSEFIADDCTSSKPFLCQRVNNDLAKCYNHVSLINPYYANKDGANGRANYQACSSMCSSQCVAFLYNGGKCTNYNSDLNTLDGRGAWYYTKAILQRQHHAVGAFTAAKDLCSSLVPAGGGGGGGGGGQVPVTSTPDTLQTSYGAVVDVTTADVDVTTADVDVTTADVDVTMGDVADTPNLYTETLPALATGILDTPTPDAQTSQDAVVVSKEVTSAGTPAEQITDSSVPAVPSAEPFASSLDVCTTNAGYASLDHASTCYCSCEEQSNETLTLEELKEKIQILRKQLYIDKKDLSSWKRKLVSAPDKRVSAKGLGALGAGMLISVGIALVILDIPTLVVEAKRLTKMFLKCRHTKNEVSSENG